MADTPQPAAPAFSEADVQRMIQDAIASQKAEFDAQIEAVRASAAGTPFSVITTHAAGPGLKIEPTWSQYDQYLATRGEHPLQLAAKKPDVMSAPSGQRDSLFPTVR
jgi:hypothetical protein